MKNSVYDFKATDIKGIEHALAEYKGQVLLIVNTASKCGYTPQLEGLEKLHKSYHEKGLTILGFPCNQFGMQDPGSNSDIQEFCQINYGVSFPMFAKIDVNGRSAHPLYKHLKSEMKGFAGTKNIKWNFTKFLVDTEGNVVKRYAPKDTPQEIKKDILQLLK